MRINWMSNSYPQGEGYGRFSAHFIETLIKQGVDVMPCLTQHFTMPDWMLDISGISWDNLTIACMPPWYLPPSPLNHRLWLYTMTEGDRLPRGWADFITNAGVERVIVPCEHNREVFQRELDIPVDVVPGGTDPEQFPVDTSEHNGTYTFLTLADRGSRKGYTYVWESFYAEFGSQEDTPDVRLTIKYRPDPRHVLSFLKNNVVMLDTRITLWDEEVEHPTEIWLRADAVVIPSKSEGWGMPHREAAMMGKPVLATRWSGLDDGHLDEWAIALDDLTVDPIKPKEREPLNGSWVTPSVDELREKMRWCYENREEARAFGENAAEWLRENQTWDHAVVHLMKLLEEHG